MAEDPSRQEIRLDGLDAVEKRGDGSGRSVGEVRVVGRADKQRQKERAGKGDERVDDEGRAADPANLTERVPGLSLFRGEVVAEVRFANPGCAVKVEWEPT